ncbi:hypothetical protein EDD16DRAFT_1229222 [Pisolithus croceorrhizus]|nr:hypothetical protein EDD16DRAFT_1229222 [Pisolithus croceorrhizus]
MQKLRLQSFGEESLELASTSWPHSSHASVHSTYGYSPINASLRPCAIILPPPLASSKNPRLCVIQGSWAFLAGFGFMAAAFLGAEQLCNGSCRLCLSERPALLAHTASSRVPSNSASLWLLTGMYMLSFLSWIQLVI